MKELNRVAWGYADLLSTYINQTKKDIEDGQAANKDLAVINEGVVTLANLSQTIKDEFVECAAEIEVPSFLGATPIKKNVMINTAGDTSWAEASVDTMAQLLKEHYDGKISIYDYWGIGDERKIALAGKVNQEIQMVLVDKDFYELSSGGRCAFVVDQKNLLRDIELPMNEECTNKGGWQMSDLRKWVNNEYADAFPMWYNAIFKPFNLDGGITDLFSIHSEGEIFGRNIYGEDCSIKQIDYYKETRNRIKCIGDDYGDARWYWERSPYSGSSNLFCIVSNSGYASANSASDTYLIAPFGCL